MARRASLAARQQAAYQAALRMVRSGEKPLFLARTAQDGRWVIEGHEWLSIDANNRRAALVAMRAAVAQWLGVDPDTFDVEAT